MATAVISFSAIVRRVRCPTQSQVMIVSRAFNPSKEKARSQLMAGRWLFLGAAVVAVLELSF